MVLYVFSTIIIIYLFFRLFIFPMAQKKQNGYVASFQEAINPIETAIAERMKRHGYKVDDFSRLINAKGQGIVFAYDSVHDVFAVGMKDSMVFEDGAKLQDVTKSYGEQIGNKLSKAEVSFTVEDTVYSYVISSEPFNPKGYFTKNIVEITDTLYDGLLRVQNKERTPKED